MGKWKSRKRGTHRVKPTGLQSVDDASKEQLEQDTADHMGPLLEKLTSPSADVRECACTCLTNQVLDTRIVPQLLEQGIVKRLGSMLVDESRGVQLAAAGCLRNLTVRGHKICADVVEEDVMTSLVVFFRQSMDTMQSSTETAAQSVKSQVYSMVEQALHLLWNLSEGSPIAITIFNQQNLLPLVLHCLNPMVYPLSMVITAAQCLYSVSEDNHHVSRPIAESIETLQAIKEALQFPGSSSNHILLRVLTAGILFNINQYLPIGAKTDSTHAITLVLSAALDIDVHAQMKDVVSTLTASDLDFDNDKEPEQVIDVRTILTAQQLALEILSNLCCADDSSDDGEWESEDGESSEDELEVHTNGSIEEIPPSVSADSAAAVMTQSLPEKALSRCKFADPAVYQLLGGHSIGKHLLAKLNTVQSRALVALHNLLLSLSTTEALYSKEALCNLWNLLFKLAAGDAAGGGPSRDDEEFLEAVTGAMRSVVQSLKDALLQCITAEQIDLLCAVCHTSRFSSVRANVVGIIGIIGTSMSHLPMRTEGLVVIGTTLLSAAADDSDLWVVAEALDAIFDVFGDGDQAMITAKEINLLRTLEKLTPMLKKRIRQEKRKVGSKLGSRMPVVDMAKNNLYRFITYLKKDRSRCGAQK